MLPNARITEKAMWRIRRFNLRPALKIAVEIMKEQGFEPNVKPGEVMWQGESTGEGKEKRAPFITLRTYICVSEEVPVIVYILVRASSGPEQVFHAVISQIKDALIQKRWLLTEPVSRPAIMRPRIRASRY